MTGQIVDGAMIGLAHFSGDVSDPQAYLLACYPKATIPPTSWSLPSAAPMRARVNHGIWIASCECGAIGLPAPGCIVFLDVLLGWCVRCGNRGHGGFWRPIVAPDPQERARIEAVLLCRPNVGDRNWEPGETVADLVAQNREHGDPVPGDDPPAPSPVDPPSSRFPPVASMLAVLRGLGHRRRKRR